MNRKYRSAVIAANWKMNLAPSDLKPYAETLKSLVSSKWCDVVLCPSFVMIPAAQKASAAAACPSRAGRERL
jgi:triosephosphate isomerase